MEKTFLFLQFLLIQGHKLYCRKVQFLKELGITFITFKQTRQTELASIETFHRPSELELHYAVRKLFKYIDQYCYESAYLILRHTIQELLSVILVNEYLACSK